MASATAVSAALTPIENNVKKKPSNCPGYRMRLKTAKLYRNEHGYKVTMRNKAKNTYKKQQC